MFRQARSSIEQQKIDMRRIAEERVRELNALLEEIAMRVAPKEVNQRRYDDPNFPTYLTPEGWRDFFSSLPLSSRAGRNGGERATSWQHALCAANGHHEELEALQQEVKELMRANRRLTQDNARLEERNNRLAARIQVLQSQLSAAVAAEPHREDGIFADHPVWPTLPQIPDAPPAQFEESFLRDTWERDAFAVLFLAVSGWAFRYAVHEALVDYDEKLSSPQSGTFGRLWRRLRRNNLTSDAKYPVGRMDIRIVTLTEHGKAAARTIADVEPLPSEWDILLEQHGGEEQAKHNAGVVLFSYQARRRGYAVELCPDVEHAAEPDVLLRKGDERLYVEVESGSGTEARLMRKWRNLADLQGSVALCAPTQEMQTRLAEQARKVARHGVATNLYHLKHSEIDIPLWLETW